MKVVDDVVTSYSDRISSHKSGWARLLACQLEAPLLTKKNDWDTDFVDRWYVAHPMEFTGQGYNLFGGWNKEVRDRVARLLTFRGELVSLERSMPNLRQLLEPRAEKTDLNFTQNDWAKIERECNDARAINPLHGDFRETFVFGDSHAMAVWRKDAGISRNDGMTLHGALVHGLSKLIPPCGTLVLQLGNIDIRHHIGRYGDVFAHVRDMIDWLCAQLSAMMASGHISRYRVVMPYPIEHEERRIPKTGWYKGTPFYLDRDKRVEVVDFWLYYSRNYFDGRTRIAWPTAWYNMDPAEYARTRMEKPGSVHLSPEWHVWDYDRDRYNSKLMAEYGIWADVDAD